MKYFTLLLICLAIAINIHAQVLIDVTASPNVFTPANIIVDVGDTVRWTNISGFHNVNGTLASYPFNPEPFGNAVGSGWVYSHVFTLPGTYNYHCDPHLTANMVGSVSVQISTSISDDKSDAIKGIVYPNPAGNVVIIELENWVQDHLKTLKLLVYDNAGREIYSEENIKNNKIRIDTKEFNKGLIFCQLFSNFKLIFTEKIIIK